MTTIAVVRKNGVAAIAGDTLTKWGSAKESATYIANHEKILPVGDGYIGITGSATFKLILADYFASANDVGLKKWSMPAVLALAHGECRYSELRKRLPEVTPRALSLALKDLGAADLVERRVTGDYPPATVYRLRGRARPLARILETLPV